MTKRFALFTILALIFIALVLRPPIAAIGPLLQEIAVSLKLDSAQQGLLTAIPVLCFGLGAFLGPWLMRRFGLNKSMLLVLIVLFLAIALRAWFGFEVLLLGTVLVGLSIAVANVLLPTLVRVDFAKKASLLTSVYTTLLAISASAIAATAVLFSAALGGWQFALLVTAVPVFLATIFWLLRLAEKHQTPVEVIESNQGKLKSVGRSALAWSLLGLFAIQSLGFYVLIGWLPTILIDAGVSAVAAGGYLGLATAIGIPSGFALAPLIARLRSLTWLIAIASLLTTLGFALLGLLLIFETASTSPLLFVVCILISVGQTATFPMVLSLIATRAKSQEQTTALSAFSQGWGYLFSAAGTFAFGAVAALLSSWTVVVFAMAFLSAIQIVFGAYAGRDPRRAVK
jgi:CP family cyanate transporter-like MFS transporter